MVKVGNGWNQLVIMYFFNIRPASVAISFLYLSLPESEDVLEQFLRTKRTETIQEHACTYSQYLEQELNIILTVDIYYLPYY